MVLCFPVSHHLAPDDLFHASLEDGKTDNQADGETFSFGGHIGSGRRQKLKKTERNAVRNARNVMSLWLGG